MRPNRALPLALLFFLLAMSAILSWDSSLDLIINWKDETREVITLSHGEADEPFEMERVMLVLRRKGLEGTSAETPVASIVMQAAKKIREKKHNHMLQSGVDAANLVTPHSLAPIVYNFRSKNIETLIEHVRMAVYNARLGFSKLVRHSHGSYILDMEGMSSTFNRHLIKV